MPASPSSSKSPSPTGGKASLRDLAPWAGLIGLLSLATFFEGFDTKLASLVQPVIGAEFGASTEELGLVLGLSSVGMVLAFFVLHLADRFGRRPVFLWALGAYALLTLATALSPDLWTFTGFQLFARMAMVVELNLAYVILGETLPASIRGRANGLLGAFAAVGAAVPAALLAPLEWAGFGWRGLFVVGAIPLLLYPLYWRRIRETPAFEQRRAARTASPFAETRDTFVALFSPRLRGRMIAITSVWLVVAFWSGTAHYFFVLYAYREQGWDASNLAWLPLGTIPFGFVGYALAGLAMDRLGRRAATSFYLVAAFLATAFCYQSSASWALYLGWFLLIGINGIWTIVTTWTTELFPTELRSTALGVSNLLLGRLGFVIGPIVAGRLSTAWGSMADAIPTLASVTLACLPIVWWALPETRGIELSARTDATEEPGSGSEEER